MGMGHCIRGGPEDKRSSIIIPECIRPEGSSYHPFKTCSQCYNSLDLKLFSKDSTRGDGLHQYCKECVSKNYRTRRSLRGG
jgi:hypothetical protein